MTSRLWPSALWTGLWLLLVATALTTRPLLPVDETRYLAVAWEMRLGGDYLVPHLNGAAYSHKPPLLFWLINIGWGVFGVNAWWPRLVAPLFGLATLFLTGNLARRLWPEAGNSAAAAPLILLGGAFWALFTTLTMFDMILAFLTVLGMLGLVRAWQDGGWIGFATFAIAIGLGALAKGPAILLHLLPAALLAPYWARAVAGGGTRRGWARWYLGLGAALALGVAIGLAWAVPAGIRGGEAYRDAIFWGQSAGRVVDSFAHGRAWWWYLAVIAPMALPWVAWPHLWRAVGGAQAWRARRGLRPALEDSGVRLCVAWFVPAFAGFSLISGKQPHYLLPEFPALALIAAFLLAGGGVAVRGRRADQAPPALLFAAAAGAVFAAPALPISWPGWTSGLHTGWTLGAAVAAVAVAVVPLSRLDVRLAALAGLSAVFAVALHLTVRPVLDRAFDLAPLAERLGQWERGGVAIAHFGTYHGQFHFLGRLRKPMPAIGLRDGDVETWLRANPDGRIISLRARMPTDAKPLYAQPFRGRFIVVWDAATVIADPRVAERGGEDDDR